MGATASASVTVTVAPVKDAPTLAEGATLDDVHATAGEELTVDLAALAASDPDGATPSYAVRLQGGGALPAGVAVVGDGLVVGAAVPAGVYELEVFASDGDLESAPVGFTLTVEEPEVTGPFATIYIQGESFTDIPDGSTEPDNLIRTQTQNQEAVGVNNTVGVPNTGLPNFDIYGLRPGYTGTGYYDINGFDTGAQGFVTFDAPAGTYEITLRLSHGSGTQPRPMTVDIDGVTAQIANTNTGQFYTWQERTVTLTLATGGTHTLTIRQDGTRSADVSVGGAAGAAVSFPQTGTHGSLAFFNWNVVKTQVTLVAGENTITLALNGGAGPNVDALAITTIGALPDFAPRFTTVGAFTIAEGAAGVGVVGAADVDENTTDAATAVGPVTYAIVGGADKAAFSIDATTGALSLDAPANFEADAALQVIVSATDDAGGVTTQSVAVSVTDVNEAPEALALDGAALASTAEAGFVVGQLSATRKASRSPSPSPTPASS